MPNLFFKIHNKSNINLLIFSILQNNTSLH